MAYLEEHDDLVFACTRTEDVVRYQPGGYHPLIIGNVVQSPTGLSYRILHKLGFGSYATVWLSQTIDPPQQYVALKVSTAEGTPTNEAKFLGSVSSPHISTFIDAFSLEGPNGLHSVIVTEVLVPLRSYFVTDSRTYEIRKKIAYDISQGVADLHRLNCVHGDLHLDNVGISIPQIADLELGDLMDSLDQPDVIVVLPIDVEKSTQSLPAYVVHPADMGRAYDSMVVSKHHLPEAKIIDFGTARNVGDPPATLDCAFAACSPEIVFALTIGDTQSPPPIGLESDVWALGSMIFELMFGTTLFYGIGIPTLLNKMCLMAPDPPSYWDGRCPPTPPDTDDWWNKRHNQLLKSGWDERDADGLLRLLKRIFILDPSKRPSAAEICQDEWFKEFTS